jgi:hypothetical protein
MTDEATRAERKLAALLLTKLDIDVEPAKLRGFIKSEWQNIAPLAHIVHEAPDYTKLGTTSRLNDTSNTASRA